MVRQNLVFNHPFAVGFDRMLDRLTANCLAEDQTTGFPPYNIRKNGNHFYADLALAGINPEDITIEVGDGILTVSSNWTDKDTEGSKDEYYHRGISRRKFTRKFTLADDLEVKGADFVNGMLTITFERIIPEAKKPRVVEINSRKREFLSD